MQKRLFHIYSSSISALIINWTLILINLNNSVNGQLTETAPRCGVFGSRSSANDVKRRFLIRQGDPVSEEAFPFVVLLGPKHDIRKFACTGVKIDDRLVLTAAHCFKRYNGQFQFGHLVVYSGIYNLSNQSSNATHPLTIKSVHVHPFWTGKHDGRFDIAIVETEQPLWAEGSACLPCLSSVTTPFKPDVGERCVSVGWGQNEFGVTSMNPMKATLTILGDTECRHAQQWSTYFSRGMICAGERNTAMPCDGDSGGPLMCIRNGAYYVSGVVSFGATNCGDRSTVFTDVFLVRDWLQRVMIRVGLYDKCVPDELNPRPCKSTQCIKQLHDWFDLSTDDHENEQPIPDATIAAKIVTPMLRTTKAATTAAPTTSTTQSTTTSSPGSTTIALSDIDVNTCLNGFYRRPRRHLSGTGHLLVHERVTTAVSCALLCCQNDSCQSALHAAALKQCYLFTKKSCELCKGCISLSSASNGDTLFTGKCD